MQIEMVDISLVKEYEGNPRNNDGAVDAVAASIKAFGFKVPVIVDKDNILVAGHTRVRAARKLGLKEVPVIRAADLTPEQIRAFRVADNKLHELSSWDMELLPLELSALQSMDVDLGILGFSAEELGALLAPLGNEGLTDPDDVPAPPDEAITQPGDLWVLGNHRLLCGDSSKAADVDRLLAGAKVHLCNTDPPYNVRVEPRSNNAIAAGLSSFPASDAHQGLTHHQSFDVARQGMKKATGKMRAKDRPLANDFVSDEAFNEMLLAWFGNIARVLVPGRSFYIWGGYANLGNYPPVLKACELYFSQGIIWDKEWPVLTRKDFMGAFEIAFYGWREGAGHEFFGPNNATDLWHIKKITPMQMEHLTAKPVDLAVRAIEYSSRPGENVLDLFGGSGSTLIGCEKTGRRAFLMELDPPYCDVIIDRFQRFSGTPAILERTGTSPLPMKPREENMR